MVLDTPSPRLLPERGRLEFHYPDKEGLIVFVPFYENPEIKESQSANYADYSPIGRAGSLYAYTGSSSRKFKVKIGYTLPHLANHDMGMFKFLRIIKGHTPEAQRRLFMGQGDNPTDREDPLNNLAAKAQSDIFKQYMKEFVGENAEDKLIAHLNPLGFVQEKGATGNAKIMDRDRQVDGPGGVMDTLLFFITVFRSTTLNNASNPLLGPPLLRLNFGTLYRNIPCVCKNYNLSWEEDAGYDLPTLTPRKLLISLQLEEVRAGTLGDFNIASLLERDNLTGWESVIGDPYTTDPTNTIYKQGGNPPPQS